MEKTNVMRLLDAKKIEYKAYEYDKNETDGMNVANNTTLINDGEREIIYANADYAYYLDGTSIYRIILLSWWKS